MRTFRHLCKDEIECRVNKVDYDKDAKDDYVELLLYKTARTDAALLDETFGAMNWRNEYKVIDGKMYCGIGIRNPENHDEWITKWNVGSETNMEAEKGQASDAMKRAGFVWGIGTELYSAPPKIYLFKKSQGLNIENWGNGRKICRDRFTIAKIEYDDKDSISELIINCNGRMGCRWTKKDGEWIVKEEDYSKESEAVDGSVKAQGTVNDKPKAESNSKPLVVCDRCGRSVDPYPNKNTGKNITVNTILSRSREEFGVNLCYECLEKYVTKKKSQQAAREAEKVEVAPEYISPPSAEEEEEDFSDFQW